MRDTVKRVLPILSSLPFLVGLGLALRTYHYLRNPSMWHDEAFLVLNVLGKDFASLWAKLDFAEAAPPLFLCVEKLVVLAFGDSTFSLRLVPYLASCLALILFARTAPRLLSATAAPWAVMLFACSDHLMWHTCEAKPYSVDVLCAVLVLFLLVSTTEWTVAGRALLFAPLAPVFIFLSYPGTFLMGGLLAALLPECLGGRRWRDGLAFLALLSMVGISFLLLYIGPIQAQRCPEMDSCWVGCFASLDHPLLLPFWIMYNTAQICRYCCEPVGNLLILATLPAGYYMWRTHRHLLLFLTIPCGLALLASLFHAYPYTAARVLVFTTPGWALLIAEGVSAALLLFGRTRARAPTVANVGMAMLLMLMASAPVYAMLHVVSPQPRTRCGTAADFVLLRSRLADRVTSNAPESRYYLRRAEAFVPPESLADTTARRIWLIGTGRTEEERLACTRSLPQGDWRITRLRDYQLTTVYRLERNP